MLTSAVMLKSYCAKYTTLMEDYCDCYSLSTLYIKSVLSVVFGKTVVYVCDIQFFLFYLTFL